VAGLVDRGYAGNIEYVQADAEHLPFPDNNFNAVSIAFGLRNVTDKDQALRDMARVLKPGGKLMVLEFSKPTNPLLSKAYDTYSFTALPFMGKLIAGDSESYKYLAESIRMHPDQDTLKSDDGNRRLRQLQIPQYDRWRCGPARRNKNPDVPWPYLAQRRQRHC